MAAKYKKIDPRIWSDEKFAELNQMDKLIALYVLTTNQSNRVGLFRFSCAMAAEDLGMLPETFRERFEGVCQSFNWGWDSVRRVVFLRSWWKYNPPENPNVLISCLKDLDDLPQTPLLDEFFGNTQYLAETLHQTLLERYPKRSFKPMPHHEHEHEHEHEHKKGAAAPPSSPPIFDPRKIEFPQILNTSVFRTAWSEWVAYRRKKRKPISEDAAKKLLAETATWGEAAAVEASGIAIRSDWQGLFDPREKQKANGKHTASDRPMSERLAGRIGGG